MRTARTTILIAVVLALPYLVVGLWSDGPYAARLIGGGIFVLVVSGLLAAALMDGAGRRRDETQDERQTFIVGNAMRFSFSVMAVAVEATGRGSRGARATPATVRSGCSWLSRARFSAPSSTTRPDIDRQ